jgi:CubicO group peptidase (beta-lactamase class C family)
MRLSVVLSAAAAAALALLSVTSQGAARQLVPPLPEEVAVTDAAAAPEAPAVDGVPVLSRVDAEAWLDGFMPYALASGDLAGAVVVLVKDGEVLLQKGYGYADLEARTPVDPDDTLFRPGSVSKLFTWTAVMQMVEQGKVDLDADINTYLDFAVPPVAGKPVTLRHVMTHTAGFEEQIRGLIGHDIDDVVPLGEALKRWVPRRIHTPGGTPAYSNYATALAGYVVERVSGQSFDDYLEQHIFGPLGMRSSSFRQPLPDALVQRMSKGYARASDGEAKPYEFISLAPAGSLAATGADMARFMIAHLQRGAYGEARILSERVAEQMHGTGQASVGPLNRMMLGFYETTVNGRRAIAHGGDTRWFHSDLQLFPDDGFGVFVSFNSSGTEGATHRLRSALVRGLVDRYLPGPGPEDTGMDEATAREQAAQIAGSYASSRRPDSNLLSLVGLLGQIKVAPNEDGTITVSMLLGASGAPKKWRLIAPYVWQDTTGNDRLAAEVVDGRVVRFSAEPYAAIMVFDRLTGLRAMALPLLVASLAVLLLTVLAWPVSALVRRHYGVRYALEGADARAHRLIRIVALLVSLTTIAAVGLVVWMMGDLPRLGPSSDGLVNIVRLLATVVLPLGALASLWNAWQVLRSRRRILAKIWSVLLALACLFLLWVGFAYHLVGYGAYY